jgi:autotransporter passenger strand-loop-strand repeat protein
MTLFLSQQGFAYVDYYNGGYENADSLSTLVKTGANAIETAFEYGIDPKTDTVYDDSNYTDSLTAIGDTIKEAVGDGLSVMVRPLIDFLNPADLTGTPYSVGDWRTYYNPGAAGSAAANGFFASYKAMLLQYAQAGAANGATSLCIGTEIDQMTGPAYKSYWDDIISTLRAKYPTLKLTYAADWDDNQSPWTNGGSGLPAGTGNLATQISFASELDYFGIDTYAPLSDAAKPTLDQLIAGWTKTPTDPTTLQVTGGKSLIAYYESVAAAVGKPLLFTEIGYESATDAASSPAGTATNTYDAALQALLYKSFFDAWQRSGNTSLTGAYFWDWDPNAAEVGPGNGANFSPQGEPAQSVVTHGFASSDKLDVSKYVAPASTLAIDITTTGSVVEVLNDVSGGRTVVHLPGAQISAAQIVTGEADTPYVVNLSAGVVADALTVSTGGAVHVLTSATTSGTRVIDGGYEVVSAGGAASATTVASGGTLTVAAGGRARQTTELAGGDLVVGGAAVWSGTGTWDLFGSLSGGGRLVEDGPGTLVVSAAAASFSGEAIISGGKVELAAASGLGAGTVAFADNAARKTLEIADGDLPANNGAFATTLIDFDSSSATYVDLAGVAYAAGATATLAGDTLTLHDGAYGAAFTLGGAAASKYAVFSDGDGGTEIRAAVGSTRIPALVHAMAGFGAHHDMARTTSAHVADPSHAALQMLRPR